MGDKQDKTDGGDKPSPGGTVHPLAAKMNLNTKGGPIIPPPPDNSNRTGISIAKGTYLNTGDNQNQPTWKALANGD